MKTAIVTGATGFIGGAVVKQLSEEGNKVFCLVRSVNKKADILGALENVTIIENDLENLQRISEIINTTIDTFYHFAWQGSTGDERADYALQLQNAKWSADAASLAVKLGCKRFVCTGTLAEFDINSYAPTDGSTPNMVSCYADAKLAAHYMTKAICAGTKTQHIWAYLSNTFGPGNYTSNFVNFASKLLITGKPADFTPGEQYYDFNYIEDTASGLVKLGTSGVGLKAYYIGSGNPDKLKNYIAKIRDAVDPSIKLNLGAIPFNGVSQPLSTFDCSKLSEDTDYKTKYTFEEAINKTIPWIREQIAAGKL